MSVFTRIEAFNKGRIPHLRAQKYQIMKQDPFGFFRGTCHLFYQDWPQASILNQAPPAWICGDMHLENFGTFKGSSGQTYFDMNDFDEAWLAPCSWEFARFLVSIRVAAHALGVGPKQATLLCKDALHAYTEALICGHPEWVDRATASGMVGDFLTALDNRKRVDLLDHRCPVGKDGKRALKIDNVHLEAVDEATRDMLAALLAEYANTQPDPKFFKLVDCAFRIAGTGSRGLKRYALVVRGKGSPDENYLLDLKNAAPSALAPYVQLQQPAWESEAHRVIAVQHRVQAMSPRFSTALEMDGEPYVLRALQPIEDRLDLASWNKDISRLQAVVVTMGRLVAWGHLRSSGRQGSAIADEFINYGRQKDWQNELLAYAEQYEAKVIADWEAFVPHVPG